MIKSHKVRHIPLIYPKLDNKNMKLNLNATEYKPKFGGASQGTQQGAQQGYTPNVQNPYAANNMYSNPYGGMYQGAGP